MAHKKWIIAHADKEKASQLSEKLNIDPFIAFLLVSRGIDDELSASDFLTEGCAFTSPYSLKDMDKAVSRINEALENGEKICIYGDYDCDGVTATALLYSFFESMGGDVMYFIPDRLTDGYGMNISAVEKIKALGTDLIITVDNGIASVKEAEHIYSLGMELIVTDHHQIPKELPRACAVINPHRTDNNIKFRDFAGVGVAFKLACALYDGDISDLLEQYADLVTLGTIGDMVPLRNENRGFVSAGLKLINNNSRTGIEALRRVAGNIDNELTSVDAAFQLCPRINAAGRMDSASKAVELLLCDDYEEARFKAEQLNIENTHRHEVENNIADDIRSIISEKPSIAQARVLVIAGRNYHHGVIGIAAAHLVSAYGKPAIVIGIDDDGKCTGSARSIDGFNIFEAISYCSDLLTHFGGHPLAAGLGIEQDNIDAFREKINEYALNQYPVMPAPSLNLDCKLSPFYLNTELVDNLSALEPYGADNPQPVFGLYNVKLAGVTPMGDGRHIRMEIQKKGKTFKIARFNTSVADFPYRVGDMLDIAIKVSKNFYKGKYYLSIMAEDVRLNGIDDDKYFSQKNELELFKCGYSAQGITCPDRHTFAGVYRFLKSNSDLNYTTDDLYFAMRQQLSYSTVSFVLQAFCETGIVSLDNGRIKLNATEGKADLENTNVIKILKGRLNIE